MSKQTRTHTHTESQCYNCYTYVMLGYTAYALPRMYVFVYSGVQQQSNMRAIYLDPYIKYLYNTYRIHTTYTDSRSEMSMNVWIRCIYCHHWKMLVRNCIFPVCFNWELWHLSVWMWQRNTMRQKLYILHSRLEKWHKST